MAGKKKAKIANRGTETKVTAVRKCKVCDEDTKPLKLIIQGRWVTAYECSCGYRNKSGELVT